MKKSIKAIIVDDEPPARRRIIDLLRTQTDIEVIGECSHGNEAVRQIVEKRPDLVFLDIQMPELNGFEVIQTVGIDNMPAVVFITAYDKYAVQAFEVNAVDYLLKPFDRSRFQAALQRAIKDVTLRSRFGKSVNVEKMLSMLRQDNNLQERLMIKTFGRVTIVEIDKIDWIEAAGNYINIYVGDKNYLMRETMHEMEARLKNLSFARTHRKYIVNLSKIKEVRSGTYGEAVVILKNDVQIPLSRRNRNNLAAWLK